MMDSIFDLELELPNRQIEERTQTLIGFDKKFERVFSNLRLLQDQDELDKWSKHYYGSILPVLGYIKEKYPLIILAGDVGTGKTASAESIADRMVRKLNKEGYFLRLSTRVRGEGLHGQQGNLVNDAFKHARELAGKNRLCYLLIDEADAIATTRATQQMHQEEKAAVNTLIQKIDEIRELNGRLVIIMSTNRLHFLDEAIIRRAALVLEFNRPDDDERREFLHQALEGIELTEDEINILVKKTGSHDNQNIGFSYSDLRLKFLPELVSMAFAYNEPIKYDMAIKVLETIKPSPQII